MISFTHLKAPTLERLLVAKILYNMYPLKLKQSFIPYDPKEDLRIQY